MQAESGLMVLLDLSEATVLRDGDALVLEDGTLVEVRSKPEPLIAVRGRDAHDLMRLAWHLGNRHVPAAIEADRLLIRPDPVIAGMLAGLGADISAVETPFDQTGRPANSSSSSSVPIVSCSMSVSARRSRTLRCWRRIWRASSWASSMSLRTSASTREATSSE